MNKKTEDKIAQFFGIIISMLICGFIVFGIGMCTKGIHEQNMNTTYEFEIIDKYEKLGSRFLSGSETEYRVIYKARKLYKNKPDSEWHTYDRVVYFSQYRNIKVGYKFKGKSEYFFTYEF